MAETRPGEAGVAAAGPPAGQLLVARDVHRRYRARGGERRGFVAAVDGVSLMVGRGESVGLVGETGSGKSTLVRIALALERPDRGAVWFDGARISDLPDRQVAPLRRRFQAVFQDPLGSLDPYLRVETLVAEPLVAHRLGNTAERRQRVAALLEQVGLPRDAAHRRPGAFSGGERQRIAIARALAPRPELLILDEPLSALDLSTQAQILSLLEALRRQLGLALLLVSHDLDVVSRVTDRLLVMYRGRIVEAGNTAAVLTQPAHPYTRALLASSPAPDPAWVPAAQPLAARRDGWPPAACRYAPRCPLAQDRCRDEPGLLDGSGEHRAACWFASL